MKNHEIVDMLYKAGTELVLKHTPEFIKVQTSSHSTATHCYIYLTMDGQPDLLVWYKTNWCSPSYEFNERGKTIGLQKNSEFIEPKLNQFFVDVAEAVAASNQRIAEKKAEQQAAAKQESDDLIDRYRQKYA